MAKRRARFTFETNLIRRPVVYELGHRFQVVTDIRMADVEEATGWVVLELDGETDEIDRAIAWAQEIGVRVDPLPGDVVEG
jgi:hypothetical protein